MRILTVFLIMSVGLYGCPGAVRQGAKHASKERRVAKATELIDDIPTTAGKSIPRTFPEEEVMSASRQGSIILHTPPTVPMLLFEDLPQYIKQHDLLRASDIIAEEGQLYVKFRPVMNSDETRPINKLLGELNARFDITCCIEVDENRRAHLSFTLSSSYGNRSYNLTIDTEDGFGLTGQHSLMGDEFSFTIVNLNSSFYEPPKKQELMRGSICFPYKESSIRITTPEGDINYSPGSLELAI